MKRSGNVIRAQGAATKILDIYGFRRPAEIDLDALVRDRGVEVKRGGLRGCEGRLVRLGNRGIIRIRDTSLGSTRSRFALSHELGHWEMHVNTQAFICTNENLRDYKGDPMESEANTFASELLMPTYMVRPIIESNEPSLVTARPLRVNSMFPSPPRRYECSLRRDTSVSWLHLGANMSNGGFPGRTNLGFGWSRSNHLA